MFYLYHVVIFQMISVRGAKTMSYVRRAFIRMLHRAMSANVMSQIVVCPPVRWIKYAAMMAKPMQVNACFVFTGSITAFIYAWNTLVHATVS